MSGWPGPELDLRLQVYGDVQPMRWLSVGEVDRDNGCYSAAAVP